jgi:hypothetical protein
MRIRLQAEQPRLIAEATFIGKLDKALCRSVADAKEMDRDARGEFLRSVATVVTLPDTAMPC